jgi:hypothetical protein
MIYYPKIHKLMAQKLSQFKVWHAGEIDINLHISIGSTFVTILYIPSLGRAVLQYRLYPQGNLVTIRRKRKQTLVKKIK